MLPLPKKLYETAQTPKFDNIADITVSDIT